MASSGFARASAGGGEYFDYELVCEGVAKSDEAEARLYAAMGTGTVAWQSDGRLSVVFTREALSLAEAVGLGVLEVLGAGVGAKVVDVSMSPRRLP
jgi:hypothetical protein